MNRFDGLDEAIGSWVIDPIQPINDNLNMDQRRLIASAARAVADAPEWWICPVHESKVVPPGPGGNPGLFRCDRAEIQWIRGQEVAMCGRESMRLVSP